MEEPHSVSSPRRILSLSKKRRASVSFSEPDDKSSGFGVSGEHGPKPSEVYGFVGCITTVVATVIFLIWAYVPERWLHSVGIYYYPSRYWALAVPTYVVVTIALALGLYIGLNFLATPPPTSLNTLFGTIFREGTTIQTSRCISSIRKSPAKMLRCVMPLWIFLGVKLKQKRGGER